MTETTPSAVPELRLVRTIDAPVAEVFAAWTDSVHLRRWLAPSHYEVREASADARPGGSYRISVVGPEGDVHVTTGEYEEVVPHRRLVMTWRYDGPHGRDEAPSLLTVEFREASTYATELTLTHARARDVVMRDRLAAGWTDCLDKLDGLFDKARRTA